MRVTRGRFLTPSRTPLILFRLTDVKVKVHTLDITPLLSETPPQKRSDMAHVFKGFQFYLHTHTPTRLSTVGMSHTCLCRPSYSQYSFTTPEGCKAELGWVAGGYVVRLFTCPNGVTHPTTNRAQCRATALIETNTLLLH